MIPDAKAWKVRRQVRYAYKSQWFLMVPEGSIFFFRHLRGRGEPIRKTPDYNFLEPPHPGTEMVSRSVGALPGHPFSEWHDAIASIPGIQAGKIIKARRHSQRACPNNFSPPLRGGVFKGEGT